MDRTTRALLVLIAVALWGLLLRPLFVAAPARAQTPAAAAPTDGPSIVLDDKIFIVVSDGVVTEYQRDNNGRLYSGRSSRIPAPK